MNVLRKCAEILQLDVCPCTFTDRLLLSKEQCTLWLCCAEQAVSSVCAAFALQTRGFLGRRQAGAGLEELQHKLQALHADIFATIDEEVRAFWHQLEVRVLQSYARHLLTALSIFQPCLFFSLKVLRNCSLYRGLHLNR